MGRSRSFLERWNDEAVFLGEPLPGQPIVEVVGNQRVLIENHCGIKVYSREEIVANVKFGRICVCGSALEIARMTKEQLVIRGEINGIAFHRRR